MSFVKYIFFFTLGIVLTLMAIQMALLIELNLLNQEEQMTLTLDDWCLVNEVPAGAKQISFTGIGTTEAVVVSDSESIKIYNRCD